MARIDFSPLLARNLVRNQMVNEAGFDLGQLAGENWGKIEEGYDKAKGFGGGVIDKVGDVKEGVFNKGKSLLDFITNIPSNINKKMIDDEGLFQGGMSDRRFGRLKDEMDIKKSQLRGLLRGLPKEEIPSPRPVPNLNTDMWNKIWLDSQKPVKLDIPKLVEFPTWMKSEAEQLGISEDANETEIQDALMKWNEEGRTTGQDSFNQYNYDFGTDLMQTPPLNQPTVNPYSVQGFKNAVDANNLYQDQTNWWLEE
tara:strand:+ start:98 stop:859 length:762 start_codon:yes stop_codon:yes gene_type:complete